MVDESLNTNLIDNYEIILNEIDEFIEGIFASRLNSILNDESDNPYIDIFGLLGYCQKIAFDHIGDVLCDILLYEDVLYDYYEIINYVRYMFNLLQLSIQNSLDNSLFITSIDSNQKEYLKFTNNLFKLFRDMFKNKYEYVSGSIDYDTYQVRYNGLLVVKEEYSNTFYTKFYIINPELFNDIDTVLDIYY